MTGKLTTHVLDTASGKPAAGMLVALHRFEPAGIRLLCDHRTNRDGRTDQPMLAGDEMTPGHYQLTFHVADYFASIGSTDAGKFLDRVPVQFRITDASAGYHVPLLVSPYAYSTYRGS